MSATRERYYEIDLLRFFAATAVMCYHFYWRGWVRNGLSDVSFPSFGPWVRYGHLGVDLFFMISGFVIFMTAQGRSPVQFSISRFVRLYPTYWICLTITSVALISIGDGRLPLSFTQYLANLTMIQRLFGVPHVDGVYWSLMVEIRFYALVLLVILTRQMARVEYLLAGWLVAAFLLLKLVEIPWLTFLLFPEWAAYFIAGATSYLIRSRGQSTLRWLIFAGSLALAIVSVFQRPATEVIWTSAQDPYNVAAIVAVFYFVFVLIALGFTKFIRSPVFVGVGALTYPLYLLHENFGYVLINAFHPFVPDSVLVAAVILLMLGLSWVIARWDGSYLSPTLTSWLKTNAKRLPARLHAA